jgi:hypothetical protein
MNDMEDTSTLTFWKLCRVYSAQIYLLTPGRRLKSQGRRLLLLNHTHQQPEKASTERLSHRNWPKAI